MYLLSEIPEIPESQALPHSYLAGGPTKHKGTVNRLTLVVRRFLEQAIAAKAGEDSTTSFESSIDSRGPRVSVPFVETICAVSGEEMSRRQLAIAFHELLGKLVYFRFVGEKLTLQSAHRCV